ncbi:MAG TPA: D-ornithine 4,5-aminomutase subunit OraS [Polyangiaceae bacterium]|nr:D-ornithine 4,5-aminomutase subunit OraS [Polyangiaceae bacterium]
MGKLHLDPQLVRACFEDAAAVARPVLEFARRRSTVSIERAVLRLLGLSGADATEVPFVNAVVDRLRDGGLLEDGVAAHVGRVAVRGKLTLREALDGLAAGRLEFGPFASGAEEGEARRWIEAECERRWREIGAGHAERDARRRRLGEREGALAYVLTATGDVYEDVRHAEAVAEHGGDVVAVIRSTAQSLLDYVPFGPTREGYGGTFATQENFRIMRAALDRWSDANGRYVRLSSFSSGLCMPEIAAAGALERLDNMVNDALYGILYRDINMERTLVDQAFSRLVNGASGIVINTGEDNYLRTADALEAAPSVVVSQLVNHAMARGCGLPDRLVAVGNAFEVAPEVENGLLYEWAHAQLTRELFPDCPVKYMPPTRFMDGNLFRTHACDTLFNLVTVATRQGIQTIGSPTEGIFTPHIHDRVLALESVNYVRTAAKGLYDEIEFAPGGVIRSRAAETLGRAAATLRAVRDDPDGLFGAIASGLFGDVRRARDGGKGREGVFLRGERYVNPFEQVLARALGPEAGGP